MLNSALMLDEIRKLVCHGHAIETTDITFVSLGIMRVRKMRYGLLLDGNLFGHDFRLLLLLLKFLLLHLGDGLSIQICADSIFLHEALISFW